MNISIKELLLNYEYVSFDIFDTLLIRSVEKPEDVFDVVENKLNDKGYEIKNFKKKRILASFLAHKIYKYPNIYKIYKFLPIKNKNSVIQEEISTEFSLISKNQIVYDLYSYCLENKKKVIITSDMYLPQSILNELLNKNGYNNFIKIYVSCDKKCSKANSSIYEYILKDLNITSKVIIHIGDNYISDIINSKEITSIYVTKGELKLYEKN